MRKFLAIAAILLVLAGLLALLRLRQTTTTIPGGAVRFSQPHSMSWDPATRMISKTGEDPFGWLTLPSSSIPVREVRIEFGGSAPIGYSDFYVYQSPASLEGVFLSDANAVVGVPEPAANGFAIRWKLADSKIVRLDLPDDLDRPFEIRNITLVSGGLGPWVSTLMWIFLAAGILLPIWGAMRLQVQRCRWIEVVIFATLIALKLVLASDLRLTTVGYAKHDDALFVSQADALMHGHWLGEFNERTLSKGPVYALFLAGVGISGAPLLSVQTGLHALACLVFVLALRPLVPAAGARLLLFILLLFEPHTLSTETFGRVLRSGIQSALTLFALAGVIGLGARLLQPPRRLLGWSLFTGLALSAFWHSREEGIWLVPSLTLIAGVAAIAAIRQRDRDWPIRLALLALPVLMLFGSTWLLRAVNAHYYGAPMTIDAVDGAFPKAYGALVRLTPSPSIPGVPVTRETQRRAAAVSPAFAEILPALEGPVGQGWAGFSHPPGPDGALSTEIWGGWFQWALRDGGMMAGHYRNAATATAYWQRVADELNAASDAGRIAAGPRRVGFLPRWDPSFATPLRSSFSRAAGVVIQFSDFSTRPLLVANPPDATALFASVTHEKSPTAEPVPGRRTAVRAMLASMYALGGMTATTASLLAGLLVIGLGWRQRRGAEEIAILLAFAAGAVALISIICLIDVTSFSAVRGLYLAPASPLVLATWVLAPAWAMRLWRELPRG